MVGNGFGVGSFVMRDTLWRYFFLVLEQSFAELVADADDFPDIAFQFQLAFDEGDTQFVQARVGQLTDQLRLLDGMVTCGLGPRSNWLPSHSFRRKGKCRLCNAGGSCASMNFPPFMCTGRLISYLGRHRGKGSSFTGSFRLSRPWSRAIQYELLSRLYTTLISQTNLVALCASSLTE